MSGARDTTLVVPLTSGSGHVTPLLNAGGMSAMQALVQRYLNKFLNYVTIFERAKAVDVLLQLCLPWVIGSPVCVQVGGHSILVDASGGVLL